MKRCSYCSKEYPDDAVACLIDGQPLTIGGSAPPVLEETPVPALQVHPVPRFWKYILTERQMEIIEVVLVCAIAFGVGILTSAYIFSGGAYQSPKGYSWTAQAFREVSCLALLWYLLQRRGTSFRVLGLVWSWRGVGWSFVLFFATGASSNLLYWCLYWGMHFSGVSAGGFNEPTQHVGKLLFGAGFFLSTAIVVCINPFFEELIARAYLMTRIKRLTNSTTVAVLISTVLQMSYHFYQGGLLALSYGPMFLIFSIYYAKTNRITPIILAHFYMDAGSTLRYWLHS